MGLEAVTYIDSLVAANPAGGDPKSEGDDHIRNLKKGLLASFPNIKGAANAGHADLAAMATGAAAAGANWTLSSSLVRRGVDGSVDLRFSSTCSLIGGGGTVLTLPAGYRPTTDTFFSAWFARGAAFYSILMKIDAATGVVTVFATVAAAPTFAVSDIIYATTSFNTR